MAPYLLTIVFFITALTIDRYSAKREPSVNFVFFAILPLFFLAVLRGNVGTDTDAYLYLIDRINEAGGSGDKYFEPVFEKIVHIFYLFFDSATTIVALISGLCVILYVFMLFSIQTPILYSALLITPIYFFDFTMNGLRLGIAFPLAVIAIRYFSTKKWARFLIFSLIALGTQISSAVVILLLVIQRSSKRSGLYLLGLSIFVIVILSALCFYYWDRIGNKIIFYNQSEPFSPFSGLAYIFFALYLLSLSSSFFQDKKDSRYQFNEQLYFVFLQLFAYLITSFTYAGIRLQSLLFFCQAVSYLSQLPLGKINSKYTVAYFIFFTLAVSWRLHGFYNEDPNSLSPFIPYSLNGDVF